MQLTPVIAIHIAFAVGALVLGPVALTLRKGSRGHRGTGYAWVALMAGAALSSVFIRDFNLPNIAGYTPIHIFTVTTLLGLGYGIHHIVQRRVSEHRRLMWRTYLGGCVGAGLFALLPSRLLGNALWHQTLGWV